MTILFRQFFGKMHSWAFTSLALASAFIQQEHQVELFSTDGIQYFPPALKTHLIGWTEENSSVVNGRLPNKEYDCQISYTAMKNFPNYLQYGKKNRFGIWLFEWAGSNVLPTGFAKHYQSCDALIAPSHFGKQVFMDSGIPEQHIKIIPHGIDVKSCQKTTTIELPTKKRCKILANIAQTHLRKNIPGLLEAYGKAFTNKDDVCLIIKAKNKPVQFPFDVSLSECLKQFNNKYPQHAEVKVFSEYVEDIYSLYRSVDIVYTMAHCEAFYLPALESLSIGKLNISPRFGGQLDFLNDNNSLLIDGKETRANPKSMYWEAKSNAIWFEPNIDDAVEKLREAYHTYPQRNQILEQNRQQIYQQYSWGVIAQEFMNLCQ